MYVSLMYVCPKLNVSVPQSASASFVQSARVHPNAAASLKSKAFPLAKAAATPNEAYPHRDSAQSFLQAPKSLFLQA